MSLQSDMDDADFDLGAVFFLGIIMAAGIGGSWIYKVWNERQMTREYHAQSVEEHEIAVQLERVADLMERRR